MNPEQDQFEADRGTAWSAFRLAGRFLLPFSCAAHVENPSWTRAAVWLPVWGLLIGIAYAAIFRLTWLWLGEYRGIRLAPMAPLLVFDVAFLGYRLMEGAATVITLWKRPPQSQVELNVRDREKEVGVASAVPWLPVAVLVVLAIISKFALLVSLPAGAVTYPADRRENLLFLYPYVIFRPLVLMPLWGRWAVLLASGIGRVAPDSHGPLRRMAQGNTLMMVMLYWGAATALTVMYCSPTGRHVGWSMLVSLGMLLVAYIISFGLARRFGGQTEATIWATGWAVELSFLLAYLPFARAIYWY